MHKACYMLTPINFNLNVSELTLHCFILVLRWFFIYVFFTFLLKLCSCKIVDKTGAKHLSLSKICEKFVTFFFSFYLRQSLRTYIPAILPRRVIHTTCFFCVYETRQRRETLACDSNRSSFKRLDLFL